MPRAGALSITTSTSVLHIKDLGNIGGNLWENFEYGHHPGQPDDFHTLFKLEDVDEIYRDKIASIPDTSSTRASDPLSVRGANGFGKDYPVAPIRTISTIGAGDSFNAGLSSEWCDTASRKDDPRGFSETL